MSLPDIDYEQLDPGIRRLVYLLRSHGLDTIDSGDGKSKFGTGVREQDCHEQDYDALVPLGDMLQACAEPLGDMLQACAEPLPNVYATVEKRLMVGTARAIWDLFLPKYVRPEVLAAALVDPGTGQAMPRILVQVTYNPADDAAVLSIHGLCDDDLISDVST